MRLQVANNFSVSSFCCKNKHLILSELYSAHAHLKPPLPSCQYVVPRCEDQVTNTFNCAKDNIMNQNFSLFRGNLVQREHFRYQNQRNIDC
mmetsp:Transcript_36218/g.87419  ORF Transcript_36218/g.87419 Transcript_36218/m.87419 type:complete len:91 (+) Transcript_36218:761-1033(+)